MIMIFLPASKLYFSLNDLNSSSVTAEFSTMNIFPLIQLISLITFSIYSFPVPSTLITVTSCILSIFDLSFKGKSSAITIVKVFLRFDSTPFQWIY